MQFGAFLCCCGAVVELVANRVDLTLSFLQTEFSLTALCFLLLQPKSIPIYIITFWSAVFFSIAFVHFVHLASALFLNAAQISVRAKKYNMTVKSVKLKCIA